MSLYLYAVAEDLEGAGDLAGMCGEALAILPIGQLLVVGSELDAVPAISAATLAAQDTVVRALHERAAALLPMRFGTAFPSGEDAVRAIELRRTHLQEQLRLVRGRDQMTLTALAVRAAVGANPPASRGEGHEPSGALGAWGDVSAADASADRGAPATAATGAAYLRARAAAAVPPGVVPLLDAVQTLVHARRVEPGRAAGVVARVYHLVSRGDDVSYRDAIRVASAQVPHLSVRVAGPSPCYAFT